MKGKNGSDKKVKKIEFKLKYSSDCEICDSQCERGIKYISSLKNSVKGGKGISCRKI